MRHFEIPAVAHGHSATQQVETGADELAGEKVRGRHHALQLGTHRAVDADSAARGVHSRRLLVVGTDAFASPAFEVFSNLGHDVAGHQASLQVGNQVGHGVLRHVVLVPLPSSVRRGKFPQLIDVVHNFSHRVGRDGAEGGEAQHTLVGGVDQRLAQRLLLCHIEHQRRSGLRQHLVAVVILNVTLFIAHNIMN